MDKDRSKTLEQVLWDSANAMRGTMSAGSYMDYSLGLIFYKYLSDTLLEKVVSTLVENGELEDGATKTSAERLRLYEKYYNDESTRDDLLEAMDMDYSIEPRFTFEAFIEQIQASRFQLENLEQAFRDLEQSNPDLLGHLFDDVDLHSTKLGPTPQKQNEMIASVMEALAPLNLDSHSGDILGDAYEYLIATFASDTGKKAGEFYTPQAVSKILTRITTWGKEDRKGFSVYDAAMGSGSLLLNAKKCIREADTIRYYGQELNTATYNLARMNLIIHGVPAANKKLRNGDTLDADWPTDAETEFDACVMNPPYSQVWSADKGFLTDPRFADYGVLAPKSKADYAFLLHGLYHLKADGTMGIVMPHGVLFRGGAEGKIRQKLLEKGYIYAVIGLPAGIFYSTSIPTCIMILRKNREGRDVLFIDGSKEFRKEKAQNVMDEEHIEKIIDAYKARKDVEKFAHVASFDEIKENDFNLNIPRYVDTFEAEAPIDLGAAFAEIENIVKEEKELESTLNDYFEELGITWRL